MCLCMYTYIHTYIPIHTYVYLYAMYLYQHYIFAFLYITPYHSCMRLCAHTYEHTCTLRKALLEVQKERFYHKRWQETATALSGVYVWSSP